MIRTILLLSFCLLVIFGEQCKKINVRPTDNHRAYYAIASQDDILLWDEGNIEILNLNSGQWTSSRGNHSHTQISSINVGDWTLFVGGEHRDRSDCKTISMYNTRTAIWNRYNLTLERMTNPYLTTNGEKVLISGYGTSGENWQTIGKYLDVFNPSTMEHSTLELSNRINYKCATVGNKAYCVGNGIDVYDYTTNQITMTIPMDFVFDFSSDHPIAANHMIFFPRYWSGYYLLYNTQENIWVETSGPIPSTFLTDGAAAGDHILFASSNGRDPVWDFNAVSNSWTAIDSLYEGRYDSVPSSYGKTVYFVGGRVDDYEPSYWIDEYYCPDDTQTKTDSKTIIGATVGAVVGVVLIAVIIATVIIVLKRKKQSKFAFLS